MNQIADNAVVTNAARASERVRRGSVVQTLILRLCPLLLGALAASPAAAQTLLEAVQQTLATHPELLASRHNLEAASQLERQARGAFLPSIDLVLAGGEENSNNTTTRAAGADDLSLTRRESSLKLTQLLWDGGATGSFADQQSALAVAAASQLLTQQENTSLLAIQVYLEMLRRQSVVDLTRENLDHHEGTLRKIEERFESGVGTRVDVIQTQGRRAQSKSNVLVSERDVRIGEANFKRIVGELPSSLGVPGPLRDLPGTLDDALAVARVSNPILTTASAELDAALAAKKQAHAGFRPRFDLELGATRNDDTDGLLGPNDDETAIVRMTLNLYRGGADRARLNEAEAREFAARETLRNNQRLVEENVTVIWNALKDIEARRQYLTAHVDATREVLVVYNEQLSLGKRTLLDLLDVQNELLRAHAADVTGEFTELLAGYRLMASLGRLLPSLGIKPE